MKNSLIALKNYFDQTLNIKAQTRLWKGRNELPFFLIDAYDFFEITLFDKECLVMIAKNEVEATPSVVRKHWEQVKNKWKGPCFYVQATISSYNRLRLIKHQVPFVIPGKQIYLPDLGVDFQESFEKRLTPQKHFSPATQVLLIYALVHVVGKGYTPSELAKELGYTNMTMTRAFNELEAAGIGEMVNKGKERWWFFRETKRDLWEQTKSMLRSPIRSRESFKFYPGAKKPEMKRSGISALAETTMINPPPVAVYAMGIEEYRGTDINKRLFSPPEEPDFELEIWNYNPKFISIDERVDPFSLYLSLRDTEDPRIEAALEEMMEKIKW